MTYQEICDSFYQKPEYLYMLRHAKVIAGQIVNGKGKKAGMQLCARGLERILAKKQRATSSDRSQVRLEVTKTTMMTKNKSKRCGQEEVFAEQERKGNVYSIRQTYEKASESSVLEARRRGEMDARIAAKYFTANQGTLV
eukprot:CAMPEP_0116568342 /NCGR_PEP_ID=MMETSP0397-20121206/15590_1 /TAXON_ID=216820 /ORGANISM="Cyclophora tenuis, Strain ECT3854" /LENGTH=139 /DNA_ID=CAMNT_0004095595 /DNA_START=8 /DNA_END=427 /DNA_ORIENTATION=-